MPRLQIFAGLTVLVASLGLLLLAMNSQPESSPVDTQNSRAATIENDGSNGFGPTILNVNSAPDDESPEGMVWIPGGEFSMGSDSSAESICSQPGVTRDAVPIHRVYVDGFWMDQTEVTNKQFAEFVKVISCLFYFIPFLDFLCN